MLSKNCSGFKELSQLGVTLSLIKAKSTTPVLFFFTLLVLSRVFVHEIFCSMYLISVTDRHVGMKIWNELNELEGSGALRLSWNQTSSQAMLLKAVNIDVGNMVSTCKQR